MATYRDTALVLRVTKLGEADRIVTLLTRAHGRVRAVAKGVRRTKSRFGGRLEPFSHVDVQLYAGRNLDIVTQAVTLDGFGPQIAADYPRYTAATAIVETAERLIDEERQPWLRLYLLATTALRALVEPEPTSGIVRDPALVLDAFLLRAMALAGWAPALGECARCSAAGPHTAFHVPSGGALCADCRGPGCVRPSAESFDLMIALFGGEWVAAQASAPAVRREVAGMVAALVQFHLERGLRSLPLVDRSTDQSGRAEPAGTAAPTEAAAPTEPVAPGDLAVSASRPAGWSEPVAAVAR